MNGTETKFKFFFAHEDEQQEAWLRAMARQGLHLESVHPLCFWSFRRAEPADVVYRIDSPDAGRDPGFQQLMEDAGWTLAARTVGWHYWRTEAVRGKAPELFSDNASKARKFKQRLGVLVASAVPLFVVLVVTDILSRLHELSMPFLLAYGGGLVLYVLFLQYSVVKLLQRIRRLNGPLPA